jgi:hypothetical protein
MLVFAACGRALRDDLVEINVPGLIERRPELVYGDKVRVRYACQRPNNACIGWIDGWCEVARDAA